MGIQLKRNPRRPMRGWVTTKPQSSERVFVMFNNSINDNNNTIFNDAGKIVGWKEGNAICKNVIASKHMLRKPPGWAWDKSIIIQGLRDGCTLAIIFENEKNKIFNAKLENFLRYGVEFDRGFGVQICLPIQYWSVSYEGKPPARQLELAF